MYIAKFVRFKTTKSWLVLHEDTSAWNYFHITYPLCGKSIGRRRFPTQWVNNAELRFGNYVFMMSPWCVGMVDKREYTLGKGMCGALNNIIYLLEAFCVETPQGGNIAGLHYSNVLNQYLKNTKVLALNIDVVFMLSSQYLHTLLGLGLHTHAGIRVHRRCANHFVFPVEIIVASFRWHPTISALYNVIMSDGWCYRKSSILPKLAALSIVQIRNLISNTLLHQYLPQ